MKRLRHAIMTALLVSLALHPAWSCSFEGSSAVFTQSLGPDAPYDAYARGRLGVVQRSYRIRSLVVAYNTLNGRGLTPEEQKAAVEVDKHYNPAGYPDQPVDTRANQDQSNASTAFEGQITYTDRTVPGQDYESFTNCLGDAFTHAEGRLGELRSRYSRPGSPDTSEILDWIAGQKAVFSNCAGDHRPRGYSPTPQPPAQPGIMPSPAPANAPLWLKQERAYQIAAAEFYAMNYDAAISDFRAIAADKSSPSAPLARYLVARALLRKATFTPAPAQTSQSQSDAYGATMRTLLGQARDQVHGILSDPSLAGMHAQARHLLDYIMLRLDPSAQAEELASRLTAPSGDPNYEQDVIDLGYALTANPQIPGAGPGPGEAASPPRSPLLRWIADLHSDTDSENVYWPVSLFEMHRTDSLRERDALAAWRSTHAMQWMVAALTFAQPGDEGIDELTAAAKLVPASSPAYASVTYQRLRLTGQAPRPSGDSYREIATLMPTIERTQPRSTINAFLDGEAQLAPTLDAFLKTAPRLPASYTDMDGFEDAAPTPDYPLNAKETLCGVQLDGSRTQHFDASTATILNQRLPLRLLRQAAQSADLPPNLRFQLAHMAWTRALLLGDSATARGLGPYLTQCQSAIKPWIDAYAAAKTPDEQHIAGLMAMMRFTSTEPMVRTGAERDFAAYDYMRDNWWCSADESHTTPAPKVAMLFSQPVVPDGPFPVGLVAAPPLGSPAAQPDPPFLSAADQADAQREIAALEKIPSASDYFAQAALDWVKAHPNDPRNADLVGFAMRVVRNACRSNRTADLNHQLFDLLHSRFTNSDWAKRYTTWE